MKTNSKILLIIVILLLSLLVKSNKVLALTSYEFIRFNNYAATMCNKAKPKCKIEYNFTDSPIARTEVDNKIVISKIFIEKCTEKEMLSIFLHEYGHHINRHPQITEKLPLKNGLHMTLYNPKKYQEFRHNNEFEADRYSVRMTCKLYNGAELDKVLLKLERDYGLKQRVAANLTHPTVYERAKRISDYKIQLGCGY